MNVIVNRTLVSALAFAALACGSPQQSAPPATTAPAPAATAPAATTAAAPATGSLVADGDFGVPECDEYFRKYYACIDSKVPEASRVYVRQSIDQTRAAWKQAASTPAGRAGLADGCRQATAAAKQAVTAYGCTW